MLTENTGLTDIYIEKGWSIVDDVQAAVIKFIRDLKNPTPIKVKVSAIAELVKPEEQRKTMRLVSA